MLEDGSGVDLGVIRGGVFEGAHVRVVDDAEDELVRCAQRGIVQEVVLDTRFVDGFCARANDGLSVVRDGGVVGSGLGRYGERGTVCGFVGFVVEDDNCEAGIFTIYSSALS